MLRSRKVQLAGVLVIAGICLVTMYHVRPTMYIYNPLHFNDGVPEMSAAPIPLCPPARVQPLVHIVSSNGDGDEEDEETSKKPVYVITPTYPRAVQVPEMTRLAQTLMLTNNVFWVVTEDAEVPTPAITEILRHSGLPHVHILGLKPTKYAKKGYKGPIPKGVSNRMAALHWLRENAKTGTFYFADDDNSYDYRLFAELAKTVRVSAFPVGLVTKTGLSTPVVQEGRVIGFYDGWIGGRTFPMDMAGFAVSVKLLLEHPDAAMPFTAGYEEDGFLKSLQLSKEDLEPLAENCTKILVWHTQTKQPPVPFTTIDPERYRNTNLEVLRPIVNPRPSRLTSVAIRRTAPTSSRAPVRSSPSFATAGARVSRPLSPAALSRSTLPSLAVSAGVTRRTGVTSKHRNVSLGRAVTTLLAPRQKKTSTPPPRKQEGGKLPSASNRGSPLPLTRPAATALQKRNVKARSAEVNSNDTAVGTALTTNSTSKNLGRYMFSSSKSTMKVNTSVGKSAFKNRTSERFSRRNTTMEALGHSTVLRVKPASIITRNMGGINRAQTFFLKSSTRIDAFSAPNSNTEVVLNVTHIRTTARPLNLTLGLFSSRGWKREKLADEKIVDRRSAHRPTARPSTHLDLSKNATTYFNIAGVKAWSTKNRTQSTTVLSEEDNRRWH